MPTINAAIALSEGNSSQAILDMEAATPYELSGGGNLSLPKTPTAGLGGPITLDCLRDDAAAVSFRWCEYVNRAGKLRTESVPDRIGVAESRRDSFVAMVQATHLRDLNSEAPQRTVWVFTCNTVENLEPRFILRCIQVEFSSYGLSSETAAHLQRIWQAEKGSTENAPDFLRVCKNVRNNVRDALQTLESALLAG